MDVLIIDDERPVCESVSNLLNKNDISCECETDPRKGIERLKDAQVLLLDLKLPGVKNLELLEECVRTCPRVPVIMFTAHGTIKTAVEAMKKGAFDFLVKPPDKDALIGTIRKALDAADAEQGISDLYYDLPETIVFNDEKSYEVLDQLRKAAATELVVLLDGETGVGKEIFVRLLHDWSPRAKSPLVKVNCAAVPEQLFESEFFGHEKGAFPGAASAKPGKVELAGKGTFFMDEVGELGAPAQAKLLQFLQDRTFERVGGLRTLHADVRVVAATNRDLEADVKAGRFREDLLYRISGVRITIPPLRDRPDDIESLALYFLKKFSTRYGREASFSPETMDALRGYPWPGNVRELERSVERAIGMSDGGAIPAKELLPAGSDKPKKTLREQRKEFERRRVTEALEEADGNRTQAAKALGLSRRMLQKKLEEFNIR